MYKISFTRVVLNPKKESESAKVLRNRVCFYGSRVSGYLCRVAGAGQEARTACAPAVCIPGTVQPEAAAWTSDFQKPREDKVWTTKTALKTPAEEDLCPRCGWEPAAL